MDDHEIASDEDKDFVQDANTYSELIPTYENLPADSVSNPNPTSEKGIDELRKVCLCFRYLFLRSFSANHNKRHFYDGTLTASQMTPDA